MTSVNFYCINESISDFIYNLLYQLVVKNNKKVLLYSNSIEKLEKLNTFLWETGKDCDFLPHSLITDDIIDDKLILSNKIENVYNQDCLFLSNFIDDKDFLSTFEKIFYIFKQSNKNEVKNIIETCKNYNFDININVKKDKWIKVDDIDSI